MPPPFDTQSTTTDGSCYCRVLFVVNHLVSIIAMSVYSSALMKGCVSVSIYIYIYLSVRYEGVVGGCGSKQVAG